VVYLRVLVALERLLSPHDLEFVRSLVVRRLPSRLRG
jgi:hypothetical protein